MDAMDSSRPASARQLPTVLQLRPEPGGTRHGDVPTLGDDVVLQFWPRLTSTSLAYVNFSTAGFAYGSTGVMIGAAWRRHPMTGSARR